MFFSFSSTELFHTERSHVRGLKVLDQVFYQPLRDSSILPAELSTLVFANLEEMLDIHSRFNNSMKAKRKESPVVGDLGDLLLEMVSARSPVVGELLLEI